MLIARLADAQHGVVTLEQLRALGLSERTARHRVAAGRLHRVYRGVYAVGRRSLSPKGRWVAAVFACGPAALLSHRSALALWGAVPSSGAGDVHVTTPGRRRGPAVIHVHETRTLHADDVAAVDDIPCTSVARTLLDYAEVASERELQRAVDESERLRIFDGRAVEEVLERANGRRGVALLRTALDAWTEPPFTRSDAERRLRGLLGSAGLPMAGFNLWVEEHEVDAYWPEHRLVVEVDSFEHHRTRLAFERDRVRDADLGDAGLRVIRTTWRQIEERDALVRRLSRALGKEPTQGPSAPKPH